MPTTGHGFVRKAKVERHYNRVMSSEISNAFKLRMDVAQKCLEDPDFLVALKADPQGTLTKLTGNDFSKVKVNVVEDDGDTVSFPVIKTTEDLSAEQLEAVAGGAFFCAAAATTIGAAATVAGTTYTIGKGEGAW